MTETRSILGCILWIAAAATACTTTYTEADVAQLESLQDAEETDAASREAEAVERPSLNEELLEGQASWVETQADR